MKTLQRIKREFSEKEKYKLLVDENDRLAKKLDIYKKELTTLKDKYSKLLKP